MRGESLWADVGGRGGMLVCFKRSLFTRAWLMASILIKAESDEPWLDRRAWVRFVFICDS